MLARFVSNTRGGVAPLMAVVAVPVLAVVGMAVDYTRANAARTAFQVSLDATALMLSRDASKVDGTVLQTQATDTFNALYKHPEVNNITVTPAYTSGLDGSHLTLQGSGVINTNFLGVIGVSQIDISATAVAQAKERATAAGVTVRFLQADVTRLPDLGPPFNFFFDRGCYHAVRRVAAPLMGEPQVAADDGLHADGARRLEELDRAEKVGRVGDRERRHAVGGRARHGLVDAHDAVSDGELAVQPKVDEGGIRHRWNSGRKKFYHRQPGKTLFDFRDPMCNLPESRIS